MRDPESVADGQGLQPPQRLYERLAQLSGYTWDQSIQPFHSVREDMPVEDVVTDLLGARLTITGMSLVLNI